MGYSHSDIGHNWAHQLKDRQGDRHFSFDGRKIMSYTTVIGEIVHANDGTPVYFLNTGSIPILRPNIKDMLSAQLLMMQYNSLHRVVISFSDGME